MFEGLVMLAIMYFEIMGLMAAGLLIQGIVYWTTGFSIFNKISEILFKEVNCK